MLFDETQNPDFEVAWEGRLEYEDPAETAERGGTILPMVQIGKATWWNDQRILGDKWIPPAGGNRYGLARFPFSLNPLARQQVRTVEVGIQLMARGTGVAPLAFDMAPGNENETSDVERVVGFTPTFKLIPVEVSGPKAEQTVKVKVAAAVITASNLMTDHPRWTFTAHSNRPIRGSQSVYLVVELPPAVAVARARLQITATLGDQVFGPAKGLLPTASADRRTFSLE